MKLSKMIDSWVSSSHVKARLLVDINVKHQFQDDILLEVGTISDVLIERDDGTFHFEAKNTATRVTRDEIEIIEPDLG